MVSSCFRKYAKAVHFHTIVVANGFSLFTMTLLLPDIAINAFAGKPNACAVPDDLCYSARSHAAKVIGISMAVRGFAGLLSGPALGALSDIYGRLPYVVAAHAAILLTYVLLLAHVYHLLPLWLVLAAFSLSGFAQVIPALLSQIADETEPCHRASGFGFLMAMFDVSVLISPVITSNLNLQGSCWVIALSAFAAFVLSFCYGETLPPEQRVTTHGSGHAWMPHISIQILNSSPMFRRLAFVIVASTLVMAGAQTTFVVFVEAAYAMTTKGAGELISILAISGLVIQTFVIRCLVHYAGTGKTLVFGLALQIVQNCLYTFFHARAAVIGGCVVGGFATIVFPSVSTIKANAVSAADQGRVQGAMSALQQLSLGIGPVLYGYVFADVSRADGILGRPMPQAVFGLSILILIPALIIAMSLQRHVPREAVTPVPRRRVSFFQRPSENHGCVDATESLYVQK